MKIRITEEVEVKACPFCGGTMIKIDNIGEKSCVSCTNCKATGPGWFDSASKAVDAWNRRTT